MDGETLKPVSIGWIKLANIISDKLHLHGACAWRQIFNWMVALIKSHNSIVATCWRFFVESCSLSSLCLDIKSCFGGEIVTEDRPFKQLQDVYRSVVLSSLIDDSKQAWQFANASFWLYCIWNKYKYHPRDRRGKRTMNLRRVDRAGNVNSRGERLEQEEGTQLDNSVAHGSKGKEFLGGNNI